MSGQVINRREEHKKHTRTALEDAAMGLFARYGYEETTVEEIAAEAGVSVRTFFRYFASKQHALFGDVAYQRVSVMARALEARPADEDPLDSVRIVLDQSDVTDPAELAQIRARMHLMVTQPALLSTYLMISRELQNQVGAFVARRCGLPSQHVYPLKVSAAAASAWDIALSAWVGGQSPDLATARREAFEQLSAGIRLDTKS
ncbi:MAG TPA: TetR family transcriptional regulator [Micromonosporaceae bacterium]|nr:TetR family transcriptional regulator [Micromonosporaceae bacterium]HCU51909.1 TetR family transcriptional regulator [Micromonosporaceae bacterium]